MKAKDKPKLITITNILLVIFVLAIIVLCILSVTFKFQKNAIQLENEKLKNQNNLLGFSNDECVNLLYDTNDQLNNMLYQFDDLTTKYTYLKESMFHGNSSSKEEYILEKQISDMNASSNYDSCILYSDTSKKLYELYSKDENETIIFYNDYASQIQKPACNDKISDYETKVIELQKARSDYLQRLENMCFGLWKDYKLSYSEWDKKYGWGNVITIRDQKLDIAKQANFDMVSVCFSD